MITILSPLDYHLLPHDPSKAAKCVAVAIKDDKIIGQLAYQEIPKLGCFYVDPGYQRQGIGLQLLKRLELIIPEYYTFPSTDASKSFFIKQGLKKLDYDLYAKESICQQAD